MTDTPKPLTADEIGSYLFHVEKPGNAYSREMAWRFKATIEQQREQIDKLRAALRYSRDQLADERIGSIDYMEGSQIYKDFRVAVALADEALATTEPKP